MKLHFLKMHGLGNDFILFDTLTQGGGDLTSSDWTFLAKGLTDRRFGIGADQLLILSDSNDADFQMRILNSDGSEVEMCGNGIRCLAKYIWDRGLSDKEILSIDTLAGIIRPKKASDLIQVDMGEPLLEGRKIPVQKSGEIIDYPLDFQDRTFKITCVSMGNPHAVIVVDNLDDFQPALYGPKIESHPFFPNRTNVEFIQVMNRKEIKMRVWERGAGETLACGTGASAVCVAAYIKGLTDKEVTIHLAGGDLMIQWASDNHVYMTGPAAFVFEGNVDVALFEKGG